MSSLHDSGLGNFTRGGQTTLHFLRMLSQVIKQFTSAIIIMYMIITVSTFFYMTDSYERYLGMRYVSTLIGVKVLHNGEKAVEIKKEDGQYIRTTMNNLYYSKYMRSNAKKVGMKWLKSMAISFAFSLTVLLSIFLWIWRYGRKQKEEKHLRGGQIVESNELNRHLKKLKKASPLKVAGVNLVDGSETAHILLNGATGTGKSTTLYELLKTIRERGDRCINFSPSGDFISWFYRDAKDYLLNPFDDRTLSWDLWAECEHEYHYDMLASALIPDTGQNDDGIWNSAARTVIACTAKMLAESGQKDIEKLFYYISVAPLEDLYELVKNTEAGSLVDPDAGRTAHSIRITATTYAKALRYIPKKKETFNIREWVRSENDDSWVFMNAKVDQLDSVRPLLSAWYEVLTNAILSLSEDRDRRIWLITDELPELYKIPSLSKFLAQSRKFGGCGVIAFQQITQLRDRYGDRAAATITGGCSTWVSMRQNDPETAKWSADSFHQVEVMESSENISYGAHEIRDGVSLTANRKLRNLILSSEISLLDDLEGYVRLPGDYPVAHFQMKRNKVSSIASDFIPARKAEPVEAVQDESLLEEPASEDMLDDELLSGTLLQKEAE